MYSVESVSAYFSKKADVYDRDDNLPYWRFSNELLWEFMRTEFLDELKQEVPGFSFLDAGCGTAIWTEKILSYCPMSKATALDLTPEMLGLAQAKLAHFGAERAQVRQQDLNKIDEYKGVARFELVISFHNVLSFVQDPQEVIGTFCDLLKPGGYLCLVVPNAFHALYFGAMNGKFEELRRVRDERKVRFKDDIPDMHVFDASEVREFLGRKWMNDIRIFGFPITFYPGMDDRKSEGGRARTMLGDPSTEYYKTLLDIEMEACRREEVSARGNDLFVVCQKPR